jgi:hypothetical protein
MDPATRQQFLINMYNQMWNNTTRHITLIWQPITVIFTIIGSILAAELQNLNFFIVYILIFFAYLVIGWFLAHVYDSSGWVNRNLVIISNIEKQFLIAKDAKEIHPYFNTDPKKREMIEHFKIQFFLGLALGFAVTVYYVGKIIQTGICYSNNAYIPATGVLPVIGLVIAAIYVYSVRQSCEKSYTYLIEQNRET